MKRFLLCSSLAILCSCHSQQKSGTILIQANDEVWLNVKSTLPGVEVSDLKDQYDAQKHQYHVYAKIMNHSGKIFKYLQLNASYTDIKNKEFSSSLARTDRELAPGDSAIIENHYPVSADETLPYLVNLTVSN